jgi:RNA polymerase sigma-70 factor (ECF subfamily)
VYGQTVSERPVVPVAGGVDQADLIAARAGDSEAFRRLTASFTRELHLHCYRMLGSFHDAEDAVQETLLRAWRHLDTFEGRSAFRAWLYRIATNVCLRQRQRRPLDARPLPKEVEAIPQTADLAINLSPYPDALLDELQAPAGDPVTEYDLRESVQLAFLAVVQLLPPRQRAVLILHDVVGFSAAEVGDLLESTTASVNSALNRARTTIEHQRAAGRLRSGRTTPVDEVAQSLVRRYVEAWRSLDMAGLAGLLKADVVMTMPPLPMRYSGREVVAEFLTTIPPAIARDGFRFVATRANRQPALAVYRCDADSNGRTFRAWGVFVFSLDGDSVAEITAFIDPSLVPTFGFPSELTADWFGADRTTEANLSTQSRKYRARCHAAVARVAAPD